MSEIEKYRLFLEWMVRQAKQNDKVELTPRQAIDLMTNFEKCLQEAQQDVYREVDGFLEQCQLKVKKKASAPWAGKTFE